LVDRRLTLDRDVEAKVSDGKFSLDVLVWLEPSGGIAQFFEEAVVSQNSRDFVGSHKFWT